MIIELCAIGKLKKAEPEQAMALDYLERAQTIGRKVGVSPVKLSEIDCKTKDPNPNLEAAAINERISNSDFLILLDENGENIGSRELANRIEKLKDAGTKRIIFAIGGADGHGDQIKARANLLLCFGKTTWPHKLCRTMAAEQIYRTLGIITNSPYHRD